MHRSQWNPIKFRLFFTCILWCDIRLLPAAAAALHTLSHTQHTWSGSTRALIHLLTCNFSSDVFFSFFVTVDRSDRIHHVNAGACVHIFTRFACSYSRLYWSDASHHTHAHILAGVGLKSIDHASCIIRTVLVMTVCNSQASPRRHYNRE